MHVRHNIVTNLQTDITSVNNRVFDRFSPFYNFESEQPLQFSAFPSVVVRNDGDTFTEIGVGLIGTCQCTISNISVLVETAVQTPNLMSSNDGIRTIEINKLLSNDDIADEVLTALRTYSSNPTLISASSLAILSTSQDEEDLNESTRIIRTTISLEVRW